MKAKRIRIHIDGHTYLITPAQLLMHTHLRELGHNPRFEYQPFSDREWRFDLAVIERGPCGRAWLFECDGGKWSGGHRRGDKVDDENLKKNRAQAADFKVFTFTNEYILAGLAKKFMKEFT